MVDVAQPLFPRYLFVATSSVDQSIAPAQYTAGVQKMVKFGFEYVHVSGSIIESLKSREDPETGFHIPLPPTFNRGDRLRIASGVLAGLEGIFEARSGQDRVIILLELLGQQARAEVQLDELNKLA
jgi:transcriptional antiterminator RfaH